MGFLTDRYYSKNPHKKLMELVGGFACGQVHQKTRYGEVYQGCFTTVEAGPFGEISLVKIKFQWYCKLNIDSGSVEPSEPVIFGEKVVLKDNWGIEIHFTKMCHQVKKERLKIFGLDGETLYFTKRVNRINLVMDSPGRFTGPTVRDYASLLPLPDAFRVQ